ncbi:MAG: hybrid sensor histidine kinase/response regulator [candidate division NC10 bacterium]|nr:hybrid sensor histidine kinase/response regulator [candidate division NC10 bacterium]
MDGARLLIVDDEENLRTSLCQAFGMEGYEVTGAADAQEALTLIQGANFDVVLSDLMMPGIDGLSLLDKARVLMPEAVIILMTGQATVESAIRALKGGAYDYILKPFKLEEIFHVVGRAREQQRLRRENLALSEINRRLTEIDQIKSDLLSAITHEFRTPLTIIYGWMDLLLSGQFGTLSGGARESVEAIGHSARRLGRLIANLLAYVEFERRGAAFQDQVVDLGEILHAVAAQLSSEYAEKRVRVEFLREVRGASLRADPEKLAILFSNLVENAIKFNLAGERVLVEATAADGAATVTITNTHGRIPQERLTRLFEPFTQGDMTLTRAAGGLGLGLSVARAIVEAHRGSIAFRQAEPQGTSVTVTLPLAGPAEGREGV